MILEYTMVRDGKVPTRANPSDAGLDVYYNPPKGKHEAWVRPGCNHVFETGVRIGIPHGYMLMVMNRSSMSAGRELVAGANCIDSGYDGEIFIDLHNIGKNQTSIHPGDKIAQLVLVPVVHFRISENPDGSLYEDYPIAMSNRGDGAMGSTDSNG